jgi:hypothetical protein
MTLVERQGLLRFATAIARQPKPSLCIYRLSAGRPAHFFRFVSQIATAT